jgi:hypothetical protein
MAIGRREILLGGLAAAFLSRCRGGSPGEPTPTPDPGPSSGSGSGNGSSGSGAVIPGESLVGRQVFPPDHAWNRDVSAAPVDSRSRAFIDWIGRGQGLHPDFGPSPDGIPYVTVSRQQRRVPVRFVDYPEESDTGAPGREPGYPIPDEAKTMPNWIEGGAPGGGGEGDRHLIVIDRDDWLLFETWATRWNDRDSVWEAGSGAAFDMNRNDRRPEGWTSADAAGLAIFPGLVRADETTSGEDIAHALRVTLRATDGYVPPASHEAGSTPGALPMGARLRLKRDVDLSPYPQYIQRIFGAMKRHGLIVADNGSDLYVTGTMDARWNNDELNPAFRRISADDFEVIDLGWG